MQTSSTASTADERDELTPAELVRGLPRVGAQTWSERMPALYPVAIRYHRARRRIEWMRSSTAYAQGRQQEDLPVRVKRHRMLLSGELGESEFAWAQLDGVLIRPGETFSFNKLVGRRKGDASQLADLLHWMVLHSPLTVTQRSAHTEDVEGLPWGVGCRIVYNYVDFEFRNDSDQTFQVRVGVVGRYLEGEILAERTTPAYRVVARGERFLRAGGEYFRRNEIWRTVDGGHDELIRENVAVVESVPAGVDVIEVDLRRY